LISIEQQGDALSLLSVGFTTFIFVFFMIYGGATTTGGGSTTATGATGLSS
jgi:hypothetical protein